jgi:hypothetical protein
MDSHKQPLDRETNKSPDSSPIGTIAPGIAIDIAKGIEQFEGKTPVEVARMFAPNIETKFLAGLLIGLGLDLGIPLPDWAKSASVQFWKYFVGMGLDPLNSPKDAGVLIGLIEGIAKQHPPEQSTNEHENWIKNILPMLFEATNKEVQNLSVEATASFYSGRAKSGKIVQKLTNPDYLKMLKRAPIYLAVALLWEQFQLFKSQAEAERWLRAEKVIDDNVDTREVRAAFTIIGLKYRGPGRPKKSENGLATSEKSGFPKTAES